MGERQKKIISAVVFFGICAFLAISFFSYDPNDIPFYTSNPNIHLKNFGGYSGAYLVWALLFSVGWSAYFIPVIFGLWAVSKILEKDTGRFYPKFFGFLFCLLSFSAMMSTITASYPASRAAAGGIAGFYVSVLLTRYFGEAGTMVILGTIFVLSLLLATEFLIVPFIVNLPKGVFFSLRALARRSVLARSGGRKIPAGKPRIKKIMTARSEIFRQAAERREEKPFFHGRSPLVIKKAKPQAQRRAAFVPPRAKSVGDYKLPPLELLNNPPPLEERMIKEDLEGNSKVLEETLRDFGIEAKVVEVEQGPVITRYELQPAPGVKINKISGLSDDIALSLKAPSVHIVAPIPGKGTVGVEVPNTQAALVYLKELLESPEFQQAGSKLTLALGKEISGTPLITDLADMPHLLIAGTTGSGKTVCVNTLIMSVVFQSSPEEVKLLLIDPKMVEMATYNGLPHLICPVVTDVKKAAGALAWAVMEMEARYKLLAKAGARNIVMYNLKIKEGMKEFSDGEQSVAPEAMPYIIIIIDELADMMLVAAKDIEESITRLAQLSRAVGIHMILATQRPSVDVITGVIKANFPARISFRVASKVDSRTVLDMNGADKLLGKGDMLFLKPGNFKLIRAQGSLVSDKEIESVVAFTKAQRAAVFTEDVLREQEKIFSFHGADVRDEMFEEAAKMVVTTRQASVSMLQRRLRLGYTRAARLIDMMEEEGIVGPYRGSKAREILVENWDEVMAARRQEQEESPAGE